MIDDPRWAEGVRLFRDGRFFEAHEEWERLWMERRGDERLALQALIQVAAACVHRARGNDAPARRLVELARAKLRALPDDVAGLPVREIEKALAALDPCDLQSLLPLPQER